MKFICLSHTLTPNNVRDAFSCGARLVALRLIFLVERGSKLGRESDLYIVVNVIAFSRGLTPAFVRKLFHSRV